MPQNIQNNQSLNNSAQLSPNNSALLIQDQGEKGIVDSKADHKSKHLGVYSQATGFPRHYSSVILGMKAAQLPGGAGDASHLQLNKLKQLEYVAPEQSDFQSRNFGGRKSIQMKNKLQSRVVFNRAATFRGGNTPLAMNNTFGVECNVMKRLGQDSPLHDEPSLSLTVHPPSKQSEDERFQADFSKEASVISDNFKSLNFSKITQKDHSLDFMSGSVPMEIVAGSKEASILIPNQRGSHQESKLNDGRILSEQQSRREEMKDVVEFDNNLVAESLEEEFNLGAAQNDEIQEIIEVESVEMEEDNDRMESVFEVEESVSQDS